MPLTFKGQLTGTLGVYDKFNPNGEYLPFDPENRQLLFTMAGVIVNAIENALTYQQVEDLAEKNERMVRNLTALQEISQVMLTIGAGGPAPGDHPPGPHPGAWPGI